MPIFIISTNKKTYKKKTGLNWNLILVVAYTTRETREKVLNIWNWRQSYQFRLEIHWNSTHTKPQDKGILSTQKNKFMKVVLEVPGYFHNQLLIGRKLQLECRYNQFSLLPTQCNSGFTLIKPNLIYVMLTFHLCCCLKGMRDWI